MVKLDIPLVTHVVSLYYREGLTQQETAARLGVSRQTIGRLIRQAQDAGIVRIEIISSFAEAEVLARKLEKSFGLKEAVVAVPDAPGEVEALRAVGRASASLLERRVRPGMVVGLGSSLTILEMVKHLNVVESPGTMIVQLDGGAPHGRHPSEDASVVYKAALAMNVNSTALMTPLYVDTAGIRDSLISDSQIHKVLELARSSNIAIFGLGTISKNTKPYSTGYLGEELIDELLAEGAVGEILGRFFGKDGNPRRLELSGRTIGLELEDLINVPFRCLVVSGEAKIKPITSALHSKFANAIVTDEQTAVALLAANELKVENSERSDV